MLSSGTVAGTATAKVRVYAVNYNVLRVMSAIHLLEKNPEKINWRYLSLNPNASQLLEKNLEKISWKELSRTSNAVDLLEKNPEKISWCRLSENPNAVHLLENR